MDKKRLLVTGASGLLGNRIVTLANPIYDVIPVHNTRPLYPDSHRLDITNRNEVLALFEKLNPQIVIHAASETNVDRCETEKDHAWKTNVEGTRNIAEACSRAGAKLIYVSTDYVFDGEKGLYTEEDRVNPINYYGVTKLEAEKQAANNCKHHAILRTSVLYGWHPWKQNFATWIINSLRQRKEITVVEDHHNTPTLADSLAEMALEVAEKDLRGLYHASGTERINRYAFATKLADAFGLDRSFIKPVKMNQITAWIAKRPRDSSLETAKIQKQLRTRLLNIDEGLKKMKESAPS